MPKLALRRRRRVKLCEGQLPLFVEKNFDSRALLVGLFDYGTCQRSDGSFYGHGGAVCHKGVEATPESMLAATKTGKVSPGAAAFAAGTTADVLDSFGITKEGLEASSTLFEERVEAKIEEMKTTGISSETYEKLLITSVDVDIAQTEFVFIGMENGLDKRDLTPQADSAGQVAAAKMLVKQDLVKEGVMSTQEAAIAERLYGARVMVEAGANENKTYGSNSFIGVAADIAVNSTAVAGSQTSLSSSQAFNTFMGGSKVGTIEMAVPAAFGTGFGNSTMKDGSPAMTKVGKTLERSDSPSRSMYGAAQKGQLGPQLTKYDRKYVEKNFSEKRAEFIGSELKRAAQGDKFRGGLAAPGSAGSKQYKTFKSGVLDSLERSGTPVYTTKVTLSTGVSPNSKLGKQGVKTKQTEHTLHIAELARGKHMVLGDFSLNTTGYGPNRNQLTAYQAGVKAVKSGEATRYKAPAKAAPAPRSTSSSKASSSARPKPARTQKQIAADAAKRERKEARIDSKLKEARDKRSKLKNRSSDSYKKHSDTISKLNAEKKALGGES